MARKSSVDVNRRGFLGSLAAASTGAVAAAVPGAQAADPVTGKPAPGAGDKPRGAMPPSAAETAAEFGAPGKAVVSTAVSCGSDFMVDVLKSLDIDYLFANTASSFRGLQESIVNYAGNKKPEFITCMHEESSVGMAHGYYKASGKMQAMACHGTVGLQHASMALYNAYCDRVPVLAFLGNLAVANQRANATDWRHSAQDPAAMIRDFTKWDDQPLSLQHFAESTVRGYKLAMTPPMAPVALVADAELQEMELHERAKLVIPRLTAMSPPQGETGAVREAAKLLVAAEHPVIIADRLARTQAGMDRLVELAELLNAPVIDQATRQNFPNTHYLCQSTNSAALVRGADVILGLEVTDFWGQINQYVLAEHGFASKMKGPAKTITLGTTDIFMKSNYQEFQRYPAVDISITGDGEATLPSLIEEVRRVLSNDRKTALGARADGFRKAHAASFEAARAAAANGWDTSPVSTARLCMELWQAIKAEDWALVSVGASPGFVSNWPHRLWSIEKHYQYLGVSSGGGVGYGLPAAVGAGLANKKLGRFSVNIQCDGDFMYAPGALWSAAHHRVPLLSVMHNNRAYGAEAMLVQHMANRRNRPIKPVDIGTVIDDPPINYAKLAQGMGVYAEGPITDPKDLAPALKRAVAVVKRGEPALVDVVTQMR